MLKAVLIATVAVLAAVAGARAEVTAERRAELLHLLEHDCGSCHGMTRKGGLGSPLEPAALADRDDEALVQVILDGLPGTPMPPWRALLSDQDAAWLVHLLRQGRLHRKPR